MKKKPAKTAKKPTKPARKITLTQTAVHSPMPYKIPRTKREIEASFQLLFVLQRLAYPELDRGLKMDKSIAGFRKMKR